MKSSAPLLDDLKASTGISDFETVTDEQFAGVAKKAAEGGLTIDQLKLLVQVMPQFIQLQGKLIEEMIGGLKQVAKSAKASQKAAIQAVSQSLDSAHQTLHVLAQNAQTDEVRLEIAKLALEAGKQGIELARIIKEMNDSNNNLWWKVASVIGTVGIVAVGVSVTMLSVFLKGKGGESEGTGSGRSPHA
jgi:hypothetical protein